MRGNERTAKSAYESQSPNQAQAAMFPGSTVGEAIQAVPRADGLTDLYIDRDKYPSRFCQDLGPAQASRMAATQRPATQEALTEPTGDRPLWREIPSWFVFGEQDLIIPAALHRFMAARAGARQAREIPGASHALSVSRPDTIVEMTLDATEVRAAA